jgi:hypothetical protein
VSDSTTIVVSAAKAGARWFSVAADGTGKLEGWETGACGSVNDDGYGDPTWPSGTLGYFDVGALDAADGVKISHEVHVYVMPDTQFTIGAHPYGKGSASSPGAAVLKAVEDGSNDPLSEGLLTIDFHRIGDAIVADRVVESTGTTENPLQQ